MIAKSVRILSVVYGKEGVGCRYENIVWFLILFNANQTFPYDSQLQQDKPYLAFTCLNLIIKTLERDMKYV